MAEDLTGRLRRLQAKYESTQNPLWAWATWQLCRANSIAIPGWVASYLDGAAEQLLQGQTRYVRQPDGRLRAMLPASEDESPGAIGRALGLNQSLAKARKGLDFDERERLALRVVFLAWDQGCSLEC